MQVDTYMHDRILMLYTCIGVPVLLSREQQTDGHFQLSCMFTGAPGIAYWYKDEDTFINPDGMFGVVTMLVNESQPTYVSTLTSKPGFTNKQLEGIYTCNFLSQLEYDKKDKTAQHFGKLIKLSFLLIFK